MHEKPNLSKDCKILEGQYDPIKDFSLDPAGYFLIRINDNTLELGFCREGNIVEILVTGNTAEEVYNTFLREEIELFPEHAAYLGKELAKAEIAMKLNKEYVQDDPLV